MNILGEGGLGLFFGKILGVFTHGYLGREGSKEGKRVRGGRG